MNAQKLPKTLRARTLTEIAKRMERRRVRLAAKGGRWGKWTYDPKSKTLDHDDGYWIGITEPPFGPLNSSARVLDAIAQIAGKGRRYSAADVGHLVRALNELLYLQGNFCGLGQDRTTPPEVLLPPRQPFGRKLEQS